MARLIIVDPFGIRPRATRFGIAAADAAGHSALGAVQWAVSSPRVGEAIDIVLRSPLAERIVRAVL
jgi:hypothetical protein